MTSPDTVLDFLIIGAGPAGLSAALEAIQGGISKVLVLEKGPSHSQMIRTFYKEGKRVDARYAGQEAICFGLLCLKDGNRESYLAFMDAVIQAHKIPVQYNIEVWSVKKNLASGFFEVKTSSDTIFLAKTVIIAIGKMGRPKSPDYWNEIPATLKQNKTLLYEINSRPLEGLKALVVGGGDSACEYADLLAPKNEVTLSYRQAEIHRANETNRRILKELIDTKKIRALIPSVITKIEDNGGRPLVHFVDKAAETFDVVVYALGGMNPKDFLINAGVALGPNQEILASPIKESSVRGLFIVGDLLGKNQGGGSIIAGFNSSSEAVRAVLERDFGIRAPAQVSLEHLTYT